MRVAPGGGRFETEDGSPWIPIGHNEAVSWVNLAGLFRRRDPCGVERHFASLRASGVTCLRLMLEYAQGDHRLFERPAGRPVPAMVRLWDDLFALCERYRIRILLTPFDTFWMARRFAKHPYSRARGGPLGAMADLVASPQARSLIKGRLDFAIRRWGGSGALFGWDLLNEIHPALNCGREDGLAEFVHDLASHAGELERALYGRSHPRCVSVFGPHLDETHGAVLREIAFRHPDLDFASVHFYEPKTIDDPRDTVDPALGVGRLVERSLAEIHDGRPFFDSENGPIHAFNDRRRTLPQAFDEECFRHMQWAHFASGGAGGGMRWPYRHPHRLTNGMHEAQARLARFADHVDWPAFRPRPLGPRLTNVDAKLAAFGCGSETQVVLWLLRRDTIAASGMSNADAAPLETRPSLFALRPGTYEVASFDTRSGEWTVADAKAGSDGTFSLAVPPVRTDIALSVRLKR